MSKAVLAAVAREEGLNLTALVARLGRTPGATRDYLQWLVDVDALRREGKRYFFVDPVVRAWVLAQGHRAAAPDALRRIAEDLASRAPTAPETDHAGPPVPPGPEAEPSPLTGDLPASPDRRRDSLMEID
jgi:hypothetical protein